MRRFFLALFLLFFAAAWSPAQEGNPFVLLQNQFNRNVKELDREFGLRSDRLRRQYKEQIQALEKLWDTVVFPEPKEFVQYSKNLDSRIILDFEHNRILLESVKGRAKLSEMKRSLAEILNDSPLLKSVLPDVSIVDREKAAVKRFDIRGRSHSGRPVHRSRISIPVEGWGNKRAMIFWPKVERIAGRLGVDPVLAMAVIQVESAFNPLAVSDANAIGLMQVVPETAGADVHSLFYRAGKLKPKALYEPETNILYGVGYIRLLQQRYFSQFPPDSRLPLVIAAYNAGPGRVRQMIQPWQPGAVRWPARQLRRKLAQALQKAGIRETVNYLDRVLKQMERFRKLLGGNE